jgi:hypothetical protein
MNKLLTTLPLLSMMLFLNCGTMKGKEKKDNTGLLALLLSGGSTSTNNANCTTATLTGITSKLSQVTNPFRTQYKISGCGVTDFAGIGLTTSSVTTGATGTSSSSLLASTGDISIAPSKGGTNVEVTFKLNSSTASLDVIAYGSGTTPSISGPTYRLAVGSIPQYKKSADGSYATVSKGGSATTSTFAANTTYTYCLDFQYTSTGMNYMNGWEKACADVTSMERGSMMMYPIMVMMNVPIYSTGSKIGFVLNGATITSFTVGNIISETE